VDSGRSKESIPAPDYSSRVVVCGYGHVSSCSPGESRKM
jgi:hypothetical protein